VKPLKYLTFMMSVLVWASIACSENNQPHGIIIDGTIGSKTYKELQGPDYHILAELGEIKGNNLFYSFQTFNVQNNEQAIFYGPDNIQNIISRVTGNEQSWIDGGIKSLIPEADFFFYNPNGIVFGPNVFLDVQGAFYISTCDYIGFTDQTHFDSATDSPILTSASPVSFGFIDNDVAQIIIQGKGKTIPAPEKDLLPTLYVRSGHRLSLIAGDIMLKNGTIDSVKDFPVGTIISDNGQVNIASVASIGEAIIQPDGLDVSSFDQMGDIILSAHSVISASSGNVNVYGDHLKMTTSFINAGQYSTDGSTVEGFAGGSIDIHVKHLSLLDGSGIFIETFSAENSGDVTIHAESILLKGGSNDLFSKISTSSISIDLLDEMDRNSSYDISIRNENVFGDAGNINIYTGSLSVVDGASIQANAVSRGNGGTISINATDTVDISGNLSDLCGILAVSLSDYENGGHTGDIHIQAKNVIVRNGGKIKNSTGGTADGGQIDINVEENLIIESVDQDIDFENPVYETISGVFSVTQPEIEYQGKGGDAGNIFLSGKSFVMKQNSNINTSSNSSGNAGRIHLDFETIDIDNNAFIFSVSGSDGNSGNIFIQSEKFISLDHSSIIGAQSLGKGKSGGILIDTPQITIDHQSTISATSLDKDNTDDALGVVIGRGIVLDENEDTFVVNEFCDQISIKRQSDISTESYGKGQAGIIYLMSHAIVLDEQSKVSSSSMKQGDSGHSGEIQLFSDQIFVNHESIITTENAGMGDAGTIQLVTDSLTLDNSSKIHSINTYGNDGGMSGMILVCGGILSDEQISIHPANNININNDSGLSTSSFSEGGAGAIIVRAKNLIMSNSAYISSENSYSGFSNDIGLISIRGDTIHLSSESKISTQSESESNAGGIALETVALSLSGKSYISSAGIHPDRNGAGGIIIIAKTITHIDDFIFGTMEIEDEHEIVDIFRVNETAKSISINEFSYVSTSSAGKGHAGGILIGGQELKLSGGSWISSESTSTTGGGSAGLIKLENLTGLSLIENSKISTQAVNTSLPDTLIPGIIEKDRLNGMISISASGDIELFNSRISSSVFGGLGNGGNISIYSNDTLMNKGQIRANAYEGNGGNIDITANYLIKSSDSIISASSQLGIDGNIMIEAFTENFDKQIITLADNFLDGSRWIQSPCEYRDNENDSHLLIKLRNIRPRTFVDWQPAYYKQ